MRKLYELTNTIVFEGKEIIPIIELAIIGGLAHKKVFRDEEIKFNIVKDFKNLDRTAVTFSEEIFSLGKVNNHFEITKDGFHLQSQFIDTNDKKWRREIVVNQFKMFDLMKKWNFL